jgi:hypothetical protein
MKPIAILGTGPAGLLAAHACEVSRCPYVLFGLGAKSILGGAQFLHRAIPGINDNDPDVTLRYLMAGDPRSYQAKVYGTEDVPFTSAARIHSGEEVPAWSLSNTYNQLWSVMEGSINQVTIDARWMADQLDADNFAFVVSTIPRPALCLTHAGMVQDRAHAFVSQPVRISEECAFGDGMDNTIVYDGTPNVSWYRTSRIFGVGGTEWGESAKELKLWTPTITVKKPLRTDCHCWYGRVLFAGRFGTWRKGVLAHEAYSDVLAVLQNV